MQKVVDSFVSVSPRNVSGMHIAADY